MKVRFAARAVKAYAALEAGVRKAFGKRLKFLLDNLNHPSLHAKKYNETKGIWQALG